MGWSFFFSSVITQFLFSKVEWNLPAPQVTVDVSMPQILKDVGLSPLGPLSERNCPLNADDPIPRVTVDGSVPQDLKEVADAVRLAESAPMRKTLKEKNAERIR